MEKGLFLLPLTSDQAHLLRLNSSNCHVSEQRLVLQITNSNYILLGVSLKHPDYKLLK